MCILALLIKNGENYSTGKKMRVMTFDLYTTTKLSKSMQRFKTWQINIQVSIICQSHVAVKTNKIMTPEWFSIIADHAHTGIVLL